MAEQPRIESGMLRTSDAATMRALAHPVRVEILALFEEHRELTASEVAELLEQTVANASFHLRTLAKHGYVERADQRGREKPWRKTHHSHDFTPDAQDQQSVAQSASLASLYTQRAAERLIQTFDRAIVEPLQPDWVPATSVTTGSFWATAEEMTELVQNVHTLLRPFDGRMDDPSLRPEGARKGHLFAAVNPDPDSPEHRIDSEPES